MLGIKAAVALCALYASAALAVNTLKVQGSNFVDTVTNQRFEIIGVEYAPAHPHLHAPNTKGRAATSQEAPPASTRPPKPTP